MNEAYLSDLKTFFDREACAKAVKPLRDGIEIAVYIAEEGPVTLTKVKGKVTFLPSAPEKPDMTFRIPAKGLQILCATPATEDVGEIGVAILQRMASAEPEARMSAKVHIGLFDLLRHGYLSVLPLGGPTVMKFLGTKGFTSMGKIKDALSRLRN